MTPHETVVRRSLALTEKASSQQESHNQVSFEVHPKANKVEIRSAIEALFRVRVRKVRTLIVRGRVRRMGRGYAKLKNRKKAIVTLARGEVIDLLDVV